MRVTVALPPLVVAPRVRDLHDVGRQQVLLADYLKLLVKDGLQVEARRQLVEKVVKHNTPVSVGAKDFNNLKTLDKKGFFPSTGSTPAEGHYVPCRLNKSSLHEQVLPDVPRQSEVEKVSP